MAKAEQEAFIAKIAPCAQYAYKMIGKVLPSVCVGMACVESAYGTAGSCKHNSYLGQKVGSGKTAKKYWDGTFFSSRTKEEYVVGVHTTIVDAFRSYKDMQQCVLNYYELLNTSLYAKVKDGADYKTQMRQIKACGYMTSSTEVNSVIKIIEKYHLTDYDDLESDTTDTMPKTGNPYPVPTGIVKKGSKGNHVRWLQYELNARGARLIVDGVAGHLTINALLAFQEMQGLEVDGICGAETRACLTNA